MITEQQALNLSNLVISIGLQLKLVQGYDEDSEEYIDMYEHIDTHREQISEIIEGFVDTNRITLPQANLLSRQIQFLYDTIEGQGKFPNNSYEHFISQQIINVTIDFFLYIIQYLKYQPN